MPHTSSRGLSSAGVVLLAAALVTGAGSAESASAAQAGRRTDWCEVWTRKVPLAGWDVRCVTTIPGAARHIGGVTSVKSKTILIRRGYTQKTTKHVIGHEYAHTTGEALPAGVKHRFAQRLGESTWRTKNPYTSPNEVFADSYARCLGWWSGKSWGYRQVSCATINKTLAHANVARRR